MLGILTLLKVSFFGGIDIYIFLGLVGACGLAVAGRFTQKKLGFDLSQEDLDKAENKQALLGNKVV